VAKEITSYISIGQGNQILDELWFFAGSGATSIHTHTHAHNDQMGGVFSLLQ